MTRKFRNESDRIVFTNLRNVVQVIASATSLKTEKEILKIISELCQAVLKSQSGEPYEKVEINWRDDIPVGKEHDSLLFAKVTDAVSSIKSAQPEISDQVVLNKIITLASEIIEYLRECDGVFSEFLD